MAGSICGVKRVWENPNFSDADFSDQWKHKMQKVSARCGFSENPNLVSLGESEYEAVSGKSAVGSDDYDDGYSKNHFFGEFVLADPNLGKEVDGIWEESDEEEEERDCEPSEEAIVISCDDDGHSRDQFVGEFVLADPNLRKEVDGIWEESDEEDRDCEPSEEAIVISCDEDVDDDGYSRDQFVGKFVLGDSNLGKQVDGIWEESDEEERGCEPSEEAIVISCDDDGYSRDQFVGKFDLADPNLGNQVDGIWEESEEEEERDYDHSEAAAISYDEVDDEDDDDDGDEYSAAKQEFWGTESCGDDDVYSRENILAHFVAAKPKGQIHAKRDFPDGCRQSAATKSSVDSDDDSEYYEEEESEVNEEEELECQAEEFEQGIGDDDDDAVYSTANLLADIIASKPKRRIYATIEPTLDLDNEDEYYGEEEEEEYKEEFEQGIGDDEDDVYYTVKTEGQIYAKRDFPDGCHQSAAIKPVLSSYNNDESYDEEEEEEEEEDLECQEDESKEDFPEGC